MATKEDIKTCIAILQEQLSQDVNGTISPDAQKAVIKTALQLLESFLIDIHRIADQQY